MPLGKHWKQYNSLWRGATSNSDSISVFNGVSHLRPAISPLNNWLWLATPPPALRLQIIINASIFYSDLFPTHEKYIVRIIGRSHSTDRQNKLYIISSRYKVDKAYVFIISLYGTIAKESSLVFLQHHHKSLKSGLKQLFC